MTGLKNFYINKKHKGWLKLLIGTIIFIIVVFILGLLTTSIKNYFYAFSAPIQKTFWFAGGSSSKFLGSFFRVGSIVNENENLQRQNQDLLSQVAFLQSIEEANRAQSDVSTSCQNSEFNLMMAGVIGLDEGDILSINKGSTDGIAEGMPVVNQQNILFGKVLKVYKNFSKIMLISSKDSVINIKVQQQVPADNTDSVPEIDGVVKGGGGLSAYLDLIPVSDNINSQDVLITSAIEKSFPKDLLVGKITKIDKDDQKPFQQAQIDLFFNVKTTDNLFVITNYKQE